MDKKQFSDDTGINKDDFIKISLSPDNKLVPDLNDKLPGKSVWVPANKAMINDILRKKDLQTHFGTPEIVATDLSFLIEMIIRKKILNSISLSNKAGYLVIGLDSIKAKLLLKQHCLIIVAKGARSLTKNAFFSSKKVSCFGA